MSSTAPTPRVSPRVGPVAVHPRPPGQLPAPGGRGWHRGLPTTIRQLEGPALNDTDAPVSGGDDLDAAVAAARRGDEAGFGVLWCELHPPLLRYLTVRGDEAPEDLAAETWLHVVRGLGGFEGGGAEFRGWLFTIARHRAVDAGRSRARRPRTTGVPEPAEVASPERSPSAEQHVLDREATAQALELVACLPPAQAEMVMLRVVAGLEVAEVARLVGKRPGTVRVTVHRALKTLAEHPHVRSARKAV